MIEHIDSRLLTELQKDAQLTAQELGEVLNLSASQAGRRRARLEADGVITGYSARLDPARLGLSVQSFVQVEMASHHPDAVNGFTQLLSTRREIISAWNMTGATDVLLRVFCPDLLALNHLIHEVLLAHSSVARVHSQIVMDQIKPDAPMPT